MNFSKLDLFPPALSVSVSIMLKLVMVTIILIGCVDTNETVSQGEVQLNPAVFPFMSDQMPACFRYSQSQALKFRHELRNFNSTDARRQLIEMQNRHDRLQRVSSSIMTRRVHRNEKLNAFWNWAMISLDLRLLEEVWDTNQRMRQLDPDMIEDQVERFRGSMFSACLLFSNVLLDLSQEQ